MPIVVGAAGGLPGELHKLWRSRTSDGYHLEYGYSCMGYEIAGALGVKLAAPDREVIVMLGDGSYLMLNSEIATSVMMGAKLIVVLLDNRGFGCINRLQQATAGERFNNLLPGQRPDIDFVAHARRLGAGAEKRRPSRELEAALERALAADRSYVVVIDTDPERSTEAGGAWWDVAVPKFGARRACRPRARPMTTSSERYGDDHPLRRQPDRLDQRRHARTGRRHAAWKACLTTPTSRLRRRRAWRQISARRRRASEPCSTAMGWSWSAAGTAPNLLIRSPRPRSRRSRPSRIAAGMGSRSSSSPKPATPSTATRQAPLSADRRH